MKLGKKPARQNSIKFKFTGYIAPLIGLPAAAGHRKLVASWDGMLGNDQYGDCVLAGADHETLLWNAEAGRTVRFSSANALADYAAITGFRPNDPSTDQGTDMQVAASYRRKIGVIDDAGNRHKVTAYLQITAGSVPELSQSIYLFGATGVGVQFPDSAMQQFNEGKPWSIKKGSTIQGGHYVPAVGYDHRYVYVITWGKVQKMTWGFFKKYCDEAVAYVSDEMLLEGKSLEGFDSKQLMDDLSKL